jgi:signal transduction histidine kinase
MSQLSAGSLDWADLVRSVHHGFVSPLNSIMNLTDMLLLGLEGKLSDKVRADVQDIAEDAQRLNRVVVAALEFFSFDESRLQREPVELGFLKAAVSDNYAGAQAAGIGLVTDLPDNPPTLMADANTLFRATRDLVEHLLRFDQGGQIGVYAVVEDDRVCVHIGSPDAPQATDALENLPPAHIKDELAINLLRCRRVIAAHGGVLWASSSAQGIAFHFSLPIAS